MKKNRDRIKVKYTRMCEQILTCFAVKSCLCSKFRQFAMAKATSVMPVCPGQAKSEASVYCTLFRTSLLSLNKAKHF